MKKYKTVKKGITKQASKTPNFKQLVKSRISHVRLTGLLQSKNKAD